jgi:hypothetical protein
MGHVMQQTIKAIVHGVAAICLGLFLLGGLAALLAFGLQQIGI